TALVLRSEQRIGGRQVGLDTTGVWDVRAMARYQARAAARLREAPGRETVATAWHVPLYGSLRRMSGTPSGSRQPVVSGYNYVSDTFFAVFRIPILRGRTFSPAEADGGSALAMVSESAANRLWPGRDGVGETIAIPPAPRDASDYHRWPG